MELVKIKNEPGLVKDTQSKAVLNTDSRSYMSYLNQRKRLQENRDKIDGYECQMKELINEVCELKEAIKKILTNGNK